MLVKDLYKLEDTVQRTGRGGAAKVTGSAPILYIVHGLELLSIILHRG